MILRHFRHEIRCFAVSSGFRKRCLAVGFLPSEWKYFSPGSAAGAAALKFTVFFASRVSKNAKTPPIKLCCKNNNNKKNKKNKKKKNKNNNNKKI